MLREEEIISPEEASCNGAELAKRIVFLESTVSTLLTHLISLQVVVLSLQETVFSQDGNPRNPMESFRLQMEFAKTHQQLECFKKHQEAVGKSL
ncbi:hypothetical protein XFPR_09730 [Xylella fastidiosa]|uniref:Transposase n=1 Tax=Xylella fastidiosa TaxID=2371 RepID=A0ABC8ADU5_XYLFS|nr:hypothetical protein [Xylella fastidiosa]ALR01585.1 hypothetical protein OY18_04280 [Xylella fastidiosa]ALR04858.1 hypothetical protein XFPR_09730 [Xylella fastidiosa]ALR06646.1 hypothetical protein XFHB_07100 [Xylella fastidiosa]ALR06733.1 hypothetical protein XFHB_07635 [Xylella fastidiosa]KXB13468.1 hypothetical protein ADT29_07905 [Xylella fastidiosa]